MSENEFANVIIDSLRAHHGSGCTRPKATGSFTGGASILDWLAMDIKTTLIALWK
jgi:hypothetical protein